MKKDSKRLTIKDIAAEAGVSAKTVSQVINEKSGVGKETRARILGIIEEMGYHPSIGARSMRTGGNRSCVGVTFPSPLEVAPFSQDFLTWLFARLFNHFGSQGEYVCFDMNPHRSHFKGDYARGLWERLYRGCILVGPLALDDTIIERIHRWGEPYIAFSRIDSLPECSCAVADYDEGAYLCTKHLIDRGHKRVALLKAFSGLQPGIERRRGFLRAHEEANIKPDKNLIRAVGFGYADIARAVHRLLVDQKITALIDSSGSEDAAAIREGARRAGRVPGKDFDVIPWSYSKDGTVLREACAQLWLPVREAGTEGLEEFAAWFHGQRDEPSHIVYRPVLFEDLPDEEVEAPRKLFDFLD